MPVHNSDIGKIFNKVADLLEIKGSNIFRVRAYRNAARTVEGLGQSAASLIAEGKDMSELPGIGKDLAGKIEEIVNKGTLGLLEELQAEIPKELSDLMDISGLGPKRVKALHDELGVSSLDELKRAAEQGKVQEIEGFGEKTERAILAGLGRLSEEQHQRTRIDIAEQIAAPLVEYLRKSDGVKEVEVAGSFRRRKETVRDLDILATVRRGSKIMERFANYEDVEKVVSKGMTRSTVVLRSGFQVDLRVVPQAAYGAAMLYFTGSKEHNIAVRKIAVKKKLKMNEYGLFKGDERVAGETEKQVYGKVGLSFIPPELREDRGEVEAAQKKGELPRLIELDDIRGDLHVHTGRTDGHSTIEELVDAARGHGYDYIAVTDHSQRVTVAHGLKPKDLKEQIEEIDKLNDKLKGFRVLKGIEVDILEDGSLDLPDDILKELDLTVCSVHSKFNLSGKEQTERIIKAMDNRYFNILAHPTGRLINERPPYEMDMEKVLEAAKEKGCLVELNAHPDRLDLNDAHCKMARDAGVKVVISTDTHRIENMNYMRFGVDQARRGWLEADDVANTRTLAELKKLLKRR